MLSDKDIKIQNIDHLGIVAGIVDSIGLVEIINNLLGSERGEKVSAGHVVKAMILNGLGFVSQPLYLFPKFFESIACEHLIGVGVKPEYLNDDKLGRVMDKLFLKGLDTIFLAISLNTVKKFQVSLESSHLDSSSMHVHGEYSSTLPEVIFENPRVENSQDQEDSQLKSLQPISITYGYSRDPSGSPVAHGGNPQDGAGSPQTRFKTIPHRISLFWRRGYTNIFEVSFWKPSRFFLFWKNSG